jgi:hypothetical protein
MAELGWTAVRVRDLTRGCCYYFDELHKNVLQY